MSPFVSSSPSRTRLASRREVHRRPSPRLSVPRHEAAVTADPLASYLDADGRARELLVLPGSGGSVLVLDRDAATLCDRRLVAHLAADEPPENAALVCQHYLQDLNGRWCRRVRPEDLSVAPILMTGDRRLPLDATDVRLSDVHGRAYRLGPIPSERPTVQLRWSRHCGETEDSLWEQVKLRDVVGGLEDYEPVRTLTEQSIVRYRDDPHVLSTRLACEFERLCRSPIVLNRGLREAVLDAIERRGTSMSEIALRCGVVKRDRHGNASGETSWLARRVGLMPEGGASATTPWIHSDVLAAISRKGLGISPREVELQ
jgi:hypothetical protein